MAVSQKKGPRQNPTRRLKRNALLPPWDAGVKPSRFIDRMEAFPCSHRNVDFAGAAQPAWAA